MNKKDVESILNEIEDHMNDAFEGLSDATTRLMQLKIPYSEDTFDLSNDVDRLYTKIEKYIKKNRKDIIDRTSNRTSDKSNKEVWNEYYLFD